MQRKSAIELKPIALLVLAAVIGFVIGLEREVSAQPEGERTQAMFMPEYTTARADFLGGDAHAPYRSIQRVRSMPAETRRSMRRDYNLRHASIISERAKQTTAIQQRHDAGLVLL